MDGEVWKPVAGYGDLYEVSSFGRIRSLDRTMRHWRGGVSHRKGQLLNPDSHNSGYLRATLHNYGKARRVFVHIIVARTFLPANDARRHVNHIDGNKHNNSINNLEWCTPAENVRHAWRTGLCKPSAGEAHGCAKLAGRDIDVIRSARDRMVPLSHIAAVFNVTESTVSGIARRTSWSHAPEMEALSG